MKIEREVNDGNEGRRDGFFGLKDGEVWLGMVMDVSTGQNLARVI